MIKSSFENSSRFLISDSCNSIKSFIDHFYKEKGQSNVINKIKFCRNLDFLVTEKHALKSENQPIICMYQGIDVYTHLEEHIPLDSYILSEKSITNPSHHIDTMPSTSWGFHVLDFIQHDKFTQDTIYNWKDYEGQTHNLSYRCALVVFYRKQVPISFIEVKNLTNCFPIIQSFLERNSSIDGYKIAGPLSFGKKIKSFLDEKNIKAKIQFT